MMQVMKEIFTLVALNRAEKQTQIALLYWDRPYSNPDFAPLETAESTHV